MTDRSSPAGHEQAEQHTPICALNHDGIAYRGCTCKPAASVALEPPQKETDPDPSIRCVSCGCCDEATVTLREDVMQHLHKGEVTAVVPVWTFNACGESWTGHRAERIRDMAMAQAKPASALSQSDAVWQPIATAPKDGTQVLLFRAGKSMVQGWWNRGGAFHMPHWSTPSGLFDPTHWRPLPPPPEQP